MNKAIFTSLSILLLCGVASAYDIEISWIHGEDPPVFSRIPENPTTKDLIYFTVPTDVFINQRQAERTLGGKPTLSVNPIEREIELWFQGPANEDGKIGVDPVCGLEGHFGPLEEGAWMFYVHFPGTIWFDMIEVGPSTPLISGRVHTFIGTGIGDVSLTFSNGGGSTITNNSGFYSKRVPYGWSGTATPSKSGYGFLPPQRTYSYVNSDIPDQFYTGFVVQPPVNDYFTEYFSSEKDIFDLSNRSVMFTPTNEGSYSGIQQEITKLPTNPSGGTELSLGDDDSEFVQLDGQETVFIFGSSFASFYVGSNGYITFTGEDHEHSESLSDHFDSKRISALFEDLNPSSGGLVSWKELADRAVVTWENVPEYGSGNSNTFQIEMFYDGRIQLSWLTIEAVNGIVGLSEGLGVPGDFEETDISEKYPLLPPVPPVLENFTEYFSSGADTFDLSNRTIMFEIASAGTYTANQKKITHLPTNPTGGTDLELGDDDYVFVKLDGQATVSIFGSVYGSFFVGSNGYITFTEGDDDHSESLSDHFSTRRISGLFEDLNPSGGGLISAKQLSNRVAVTWENVPEYGSSNSNTFQIEMFLDGRIHISWLTIEAENGIVGLSEGLGVPEDFEEVDFSEL
ncbi:MAG: hypothetical protein ACYS6K_13840 [Planctomycetota bacterium]|jgi:hypothetical protein